MNETTKWIIGAALLLLAFGKKLAFAVKPGVQLPETEEMSYALEIVSDVWSRHGYIPTITSGLEGEHREDSLHYSGMALDFRTKDLQPFLKQQMISEVQSILGNNYDVLLEFAGSPNEHMHIEYDPA